MPEIVSQGQWIMLVADAFLIKLLHLLYKVLKL